MATERTSGKTRIDIGSLLDALDALDSAEASDSSPLSYRSNGHDGLTDIDSDHELKEAVRAVEAERSVEGEAERSEEGEAASPRSARLRSFRSAPPSESTGPQEPTAP
jgi:hypothetical protein